MAKPIFYAHWPKLDGVPEMRALPEGFDRMPVDPEALAKWCADNGLSVDDESTALFQAWLFGKREWE